MIKPYIKTYSLLFNIETTKYINAPPKATPIIPIFWSLLVIKATVAIIIAITAPTICPIIIPAFALCVIALNNVIITTVHVNIISGYATLFDLMYCSLVIAQISFQPKRTFSIFIIIPYPALCCNCSVQITQRFYFCAYLF